MLEPTFLLLCSKVIIDSNTRAMSLIELIDMARMSLPLPADQVVVAPLDL